MTTLETKWKCDRCGAIGKGDRFDNPDGLSSFIDLCDGCKKSFERWRKRK